MDIICLEDSTELLQINNMNGNEDDSDDLDDNHDLSTGSNCNEQLLIPPSNTNKSSNNNNTGSSNKLKIDDLSICYRINKFLVKNWYFNLLLPITILLIISFILYFCRDYAKYLLIWIEHQNPWLIFIVFMLMFTIVSYPIVIGYLVLIITTGYLFGLVKGLLTVIIGANLGVAIAHNSIRSLQKRCSFHRLIKNETGRAILRVISGPRAFKVVIFTRLTPIPFGLQNTIFGISSIKARSYHTATLIGLLPAQAINVYLGSTLRSMHDVLNDNNTELTGYIVFIVQVLIGVGLMMWVVQRAKTELSEALLFDVGTEHKIIDIDV